MIDAKIGKFIGRHHVMTIATVGEGGEPYCANLFYSYIPAENIFVFTSGPTTRHSAEMYGNPVVAASIVLETKVVGKIQGIQMQGVVKRPEGAELKAARSSYIRRFPYAVAADLDLWTFAPSFMKLTDNTLGFGKKLIWNADE